MWVTLCNADCNCDLTKHNCDLQCCCDPDCTVTQLVYSTKCNMPNTENYLNMCSMNVDGQPVFKWTPGCLYSINNEQLLNVPSEWSKETLSDSDMTGEMEPYLTESTSSQSRYYKLGQPVRVEYSSGEIGELLMGYPIFGEVCDETVPITFAQNAHTYCPYHVSGVSGVDTIPCEQLPGVPGLATTTGTFLVHPVPLINGNDLITPTISCFAFGTNVPIDCPSTGPSAVSVTQSSFVCTNVTRKLVYRFTFEATGTIVAMELIALIGETTDYFHQETIVTFMQVNVSLDAPTSISTSYLYGQPVIGARATPSTLFSKTASTVAITMSPTSMSEPILTSQNGTIYSKTGGLWNIPAGGSCFSAANNQFLFMESVKFGVDTFSGCTLNLSHFLNLLGDPRSGASWCTRLQNLLWNMLYNSVGQMGNTDEQEPIRYANLPPDHLAAWPSVQTNVTGNWVPIQNVFMASQPNDPISRVGICASMLVGQDTEVQFSRFGSITNPQYHIVGAKATQIYGDIVMGPALSTVEITVRVRFTDVTPSARVRRLS
ncbi:hypothetical protein PHET_06951 [Paragonimus heterotremus]|uniref:Tectonic domain-containing protein n=1 Tax=Paragonimus heterotremus TaxID=100268 RepID=A0A8J4SIW5_9TREM|nr:hypothetical protein PHET_06951 [Paragonimus heterotremus]